MCIDRLDSYECVCTAGWNGTNCDEGKREMIVIKYYICNGYILCLISIFFQTLGNGLFHLKTTPPVEEGNSVTIPVEQTVKFSRKI